MKISKHVLAALALLVGIATSGTATAQQEPGRPGMMQRHRMHQHAMLMIDRDTVNMVIDTWPERPRAVARTMMQKYGLPDEMTPSYLIWRDKGPWKKTAVSRHEVRHDWPKPHTDVLRQVIDYRVPVDKFDDLAAFDGSVIAERTAGELAAHCDNEAMNYLAINLAHDIVEGRRTVADARRAYTEHAMKAMKGELTDYTRGIRFELPAAGTTGDPDRPARATARERDEPGTY